MIRRFFFFNQYIDPNYPRWTEILALWNTRFFDVFSFGVMVFAAFMIRFADQRVAWASGIFVFILSAPRIMVGAHWFSDVYMGSPSIALFVLPWVLLTPAGVALAQAFSKILQHGSHFLRAREHPNK